MEKAIDLGGIYCAPLDLAKGTYDIGKSFVEMEKEAWDSFLELTK